MRITITIRGDVDHADAAVFAAHALTDCMGTGYSEFELTSGIGVVSNYVGGLAAFVRKTSAGFSVRVWKAGTTQ